MTEAENTFVNCQQFLEFLKTMAWCKQAADVLVCVHKCTPEVIEAIRDHELKVFPGGLIVKMNKSALHHMQERYEDGQPLPAVLVWKKEGVEVWYRRHKPEDFPYDSWTNSAAAAYERERVFIPSEALGPDFIGSHVDFLARANACPDMMPPY